MPHKHWLPPCAWVTWGHTDQVPKKPEGWSSPRPTLLLLLSPGSSPTPHRHHSDPGTAHHAAGHMVHHAGILRSQQEIHEPAELAG